MPTVSQGGGVQLAMQHETCVVRDPLPFLIRAGEVLAGSLDLEQTLRGLLDLVVPPLADMCSIHLLDDDGRFRRIGARHHTHEAMALSDGLTDHYIDSGQRDGPIHRLLARGESLLSSPVTDDALDLIVGPERRVHIVQLGLTSAMVVPLAAHGRPFGVLCLSRAVRPLFERTHLHLAEELGRRAAFALDSARLYRAVSQSRLAAERARQRTAFLAQASAALATSLDIRTTLQTVVQLAVPEMAEGCSVALLNEDGSLRQVAVAHADPALQALQVEHWPIIPLGAYESHPIAVAFATGRPHVDNAITDETRQRYASGAYLGLLRRLDVRARMVVPLEARGRRIGALTLASSDPARTFDDDDVALGVELASRAALALENARLYRQVATSERALHRLVHQLMVAQEDERRRLAYEIHDGFAQTAAGVQQLVEAYDHDFPAEAGPARDRMAVTIRLARRTVSEIRRVLSGLRPTVLDDFGLERGLRAHADGLAGDNLQVTVTGSLGVDRLGSEVEIALFRLAQEALTNVRRHAEVGQAILRLGREDDHVVLEVEDRGKGFDLMAVQHGEHAGEHLGLLSMHERIAQVGGTLDITSRRGEGTLVRAVVPVSRPARTKGRGRVRRGR